VPINKKAVPEILITHLMEGIGIALDVPGNRMFAPTSPVRSIRGPRWKERAQLPLRQGNLTGIAYATV